MPNPYRGLPSVDALLRHEAIRALEAQVPVERLAEHVRVVIDRARHSITADRDDLSSPTAPKDSEANRADSLAAEVVASVARAAAPSLVPAINATGVIIHTNLGRAPLSADAIIAMEAVSRGYSNLEFDLESGKRGSRLGHLETLIQAVVGAEGGLAVNNNASALLLVLSALAKGREVIISRGQAVEIGGGFRIPDVLRESGATLVEVGTTNRTRAADYSNAVTENTAAILRVHSSNFKIVGFTEEASLRELRAVADEHGVLLLDDIGSGCLLDTTRFGLAPEPTPQESIAARVDLTMFSGDKLLGGPQAGIVAGRLDLIDQLKRHPLARALRSDKGTIAALIATLRHYFLGEAEEQIPVWRMISSSAPAERKRAEAWQTKLGSGSVQESHSMIGGGSMPGESLPTFVLALGAASMPPGVSAAGFAERLRLSDPAVVARVENDSVLIDPRTVSSRDEAALVAVVGRALAP
jgi:L-seryl-tRNA(Ser) seleniumtransferase